MTQTLNDIMEPDHVIRVDEGGTISDNVPGVWAPEFQVGVNEDGQILDEHEKEMIEEVRRQGWELLSGWTGQHMYAGPIMHPSEFVGGRLEEHIRETPGFYCVIVVETDDDDDEPAGWAIAYRPLPERTRMPFKHFEGLKSTHGDQIGVSVPCAVNLCLNEMALIMTMQMAEPTSIEAVEGVLSRFMQQRHGRLVSLSEAIEFYSGDPELNEETRRNRAKIAKLYGWTIED